MSEWNIALYVAYQNGISHMHIKMEFWHEFDAI